MVSIVNHPNWLTFARNPINKSKCPRVAIYVNIRLSSFCFSLHRDIIDFRDILLVSFFNNNDIFWLMNIYSDSSYSTLKYLKDTEVNIRNLLIIADSFNLNLSIPTNQVLTRYSDNINDLNSVINLIFLQYNSFKLDNHSIHPKWHLISDHTPLIIIIPIVEKNINSRKKSIIKDSDENKQFIQDLIASIRNLNMSNLSDISHLENTIKDFANSIDKAWAKNSKMINVTKYSKSWWNKNCSKDLEKYRRSKSLKD